jgi:shikimate dehydrogenase
MRKALNSGRLTRMQKMQKQQANAGRTPQSQSAVGELEGGTTRELERASTTTEPREIGGPKGVEPTRFGDWERAGRCIDF